VLARNGAGLVPAATGNEARRIVSFGKQDTSSPQKSPRQPSGAKSSVTHVSGRLRGEESDTYPTIVCRLNDRWRVIACRSQIQWILQRRGGDRWNDQYYFRTREGLMLFVREYAGEIHGDALVTLLRLPERFPEGASS
jgi:hypothetical protein